MKKQENDCFMVWSSPVQFSCSVVSDSLWPHESQHARPPCPSGHRWRAPKLMCIESVMPPSHLLLCRPLLLLPPIPPSIRVFSNESTLGMRWPKYWSFSLNIRPSNEHPGLISFRMDWWISLQSKGLWRIFSNTTVQKHQLFYSIVIGTVASQYLTLYTNDEYTIKYLWYILLQSYS